MLRLCVKDGALVRIGVYIGLPLYLLQAGTFYRWSGEAFLYVTIAITTALAVTGAIIDDVFGADALFCSLPLSRSTIVAARYLWGLISLAVGLVLCVGYGRLLGALIGAPASGFAGPPDVAAALTVALLTAALLCVWYPFYFRWGLGKGTLLFLAAVLALGALVSTTVLALRALGASLPGRAGSPVSMVRAAVIRVGAAPATAIAVGILGSAAYLSLRLSTRFYERRDF